MPSPELDGQPVFYYDLGSPVCYLAAETISSTLPVVAEWEPVLASQLDVPEPPLDRAWVEHRSVELGIQPLCWPEAWPPDSALAMQAATYAKGIGRVVAFSLAAFRQAFAAGRDLGDRDTVLIAGAACEMHPSALLKGIELRSVAEGLQRATAQARAAGVLALPAIAVSGDVFGGADAVREAALALGALR
jgi:2-hydroxychromene-2-carboxylate isomerase